MLWMPIAVTALAVVALLLLVVSGLLFYIIRLQDVRHEFVSSPRPRSFS